MKVDMSCPKCGGRATEYDKEKWMCLKCGNKFLYAPLEPPAVQHFINVSGTNQYDLDASGATAARPLYEDAGHYSRSVEESENEANRIFGHFIAIVIGVLLLTGVTYALAQTNSAWGALTALGAFYGFFGPFLSVLEELGNARSSLRSAREYRLKYEQSEKKPYGYQPLCPHCRADVNAVNNVLTHCLKCGKQFYYVEPTSYPIKVR